MNQNIMNTIFHSISGAYNILQLTCVSILLFVVCSEKYQIIEIQYKCIESYFKTILFNLHYPFLSNCTEVVCR